jgi:hypothetical protein
MTSQRIGLTIGHSLINRAAIVPIFGALIS